MEKMPAGPLQLGRQRLLLLLLLLILFGGSLPPPSVPEVVTTERTTAAAYPSDLKRLIPTSNPPSSVQAAPAAQSLAPKVRRNQPPPVTAPITSTVFLPIVGSKPDAVRFAAIGDYGLAGAPEEQVAQLVSAWGPDLIITLGDNNYPDGAAESIDENIGRYYSEYIYPYHGAYGSGATVNRFFPSPGNHDWNTPGLMPYLDYFTLPGNERYYDFTWGPIHFFAVDSDSREPDGVSAASAQANWLQARLAGSTAPWKIVYMHHPPYSSGWHGSTDWMQWPFQDWGASAVLAGHDHLYERLQVDGGVYVVNGLGGYPARYTFQDPLPGSQVRYNDDYGAMFVEATSQTLEITFRSQTGQLIDRLLLSIDPR